MNFAAMGGFVRRSFSAVALLLLVVYSVLPAQAARIHLDMRQSNATRVAVNSTLADGDGTEPDAISMSDAVTTTTSTTRSVQTTTITITTSTARSSASTRAVISTRASTTRTPTSSRTSATPTTRQPLPTSSPKTAVAAVTFSLPSNVNNLLPSTTSGSLPVVQTAPSETSVIPVPSAPSKSLWSNKAGLSAVILVPTLIILASAAYLLLLWRRRRMANRHQRIDDEMFETFTDHHPPTGSFSYAPSLMSPHADPFQAPAIRVHPPSTASPELYPVSRNHYRDFSSGHSPSGSQGQTSTEQWLAPPPPTTAPRKPGLRESFDSFLNAYTGKRSSYRI